MSPLVVLGALGTLFSTITILPHLARAIRTRRPGGSPLAWAMGAAGSVVWLTYGIASGDLLVGAPGFVTIPAGVLLTIWSSREARPVVVAVPDPVTVHPIEEALPPTLEMPAVA